MKAEFYIDNLTCLGCKNTILKEAKKQDQVKNVEVDMQESKVILEYEGKEEVVHRVKSRLLRKGYPEKGRKQRSIAAKTGTQCVVNQKQGSVIISVGIL